MKKTPLLEFSAHILKGDPDSILEKLKVLGYPASAIEEKADRASRTLKTYLKNRREAHELKKTLSGLTKSAFSNFQLKKIPFDGWASRWKKGLKVIRISNRLVIRPSWIKYTRKNREKIIALDPKMAFGTGHHPTTRMCLDWLIPNAHAWKNALDIGCGSGILAIAAAKMGTRKILGIDIDSDAIKAAKKNAVLNRVSEKIRFTASDLKKFKHPGNFDAVLANLTALDIKKNWKEMIRFVKINHGILFLAGIEQHQQSWFEPWLKSLRKIKILERKTETNWLGYKLIRI